ncbi:helix-turn-helix domain-containing protein [Actinomadura roseirufa]|uniref:helix-turn-helix domain-containing protein n=1 Tax=Actinomadura roseirufa TaxID=2094049 RepID=UPI001041334A|nr:helix-turn-helix transcriptional regulator [Actinomadura roseirufa]
MPETFDKALRELMIERGIGVRALAREVPCDASHLSKICLDRKRTSERTAKRFDEILGGGGRLVELLRTTAKEAVPVGTVGSEVPHPLNEDDEMERRRLLQALATLGVTMAPAAEAIHQIRDGVDHAIGLGEDRHLDEWEETVAEYGHSYRLVPPAELLKNLSSDLVAIQRTTSRRPALRHLPDWYRVTGGLALPMAKTLSNMDQPQLARNWWTTAQHAADSSRDPDLSLWVSGERLIHGLYERRPAVVLMRQASRIIDRAPAAPRRGLIHVRAAHAQMLAQEGASSQATAELRACGEIFQRLPASVTRETRSIYGWSEHRLRYTQAWCHAYSGEQGELDAAVARGREMLPADDGRVHAQLELMRAAGHVRAGDTSEGVRQAHAVYEAQPAEQRTLMVSSLARQVAEAVPARSRAEPVVLGYRELLAAGNGAASIT